MPPQRTAPAPQPAGTREQGDSYACARAWAALTAAHAALTERLSEALLRACGLSINDFEVLLRLDQEPAPGLRLGDLTQTVRLSQPALSRMIARLERRGLLSRSGDPSDRRGVIVSLTDAGAATLRAAVPVHARTVREALLDRLSPDEHNQLTEVLGRIART